MTRSTSCYTDEFWGAKIRTCDVDYHEEYEGEVFDEIINLILNKGYEVIPSEIKMMICLDEECEEAEYIWFDPMDYLTEEQLRKIERELKKLEEDES